MKPNYTIEKEVKVGIWENRNMVARIYDDKVIVIEPYVRWMGNSGVLAEAKKSIRNPKTVARINQEMTDDCEDTAWEIIEQDIDRY
jgi:hypothetical protein